MKIRLSLLALGAMLCASAFAQKDTVYVRMDFNANPWNLPTASIIKGWSTVDWDNAPAGSIFSTTTEFPIAVGEGTLKMTLSPSDLDETDYENVYVNGPNYDIDMNGSVMENYLFTYTGSKMTFTAPEDYSMSRVAFETYRTWASGGLSMNPVTNLHTWGPDSAKVVTQVYQGQTYTYEAWSGDSIEWSLPACTSSTRLRYIDFWLIPTSEAAITTIDNDDNREERLYSIDGKLMPADAAPQKGLYIINGRKRWVP